MPDGNASDATLLARAYQISYVTRDIDACLERFRARFGVERFLVRHNHSTPGSSGMIRHLALAWVDGLQIELIEPNPDRPGIYAKDLALGDGSAFFHHVNHMLTSEAQWQALEALVAHAGLPVEVSGTVGPDFRYSYPDGRKDFSHFLEFSLRLEGSNAVAYVVPENPSSSAAVYPLFGGFFQRGYVTHDLDVAMKRLSDAYGITRFHEIRNLSGPGREHYMSRHIALAWLGDTMIELIEPNPAIPTIYADTLPPPGEVIRLHHLGFTVADDAAFAVLEQRLAALGLRVSASGDYGAFLRFLYADARAELGHQLEYIRLGDEGRALFASVPRN